jgi:HK97 family phage major capsid protein
VTAQYGQRLLKELDEVIIQGDGTTQPEGVINQTGVNTVSFGAAATVSMYMQLLFAVTKEFKRGYSANRIAFFGSEVSYRRARDIQVGASDQRLVFEYDVESYSLLGHPYLIDDTLSNQIIGFCNFAWYRMYRRLGLTITSTTEGKTLKRLNQLLIVMRSRWGGALTHGDACSKTTNAAS